MAGLAAILRRLLRLVSRELSSFNAIAGNNLLLILYLLGQGGGAAAAFPALILGTLVLLPMSAHPLRKIPPERLALWPLTPRQRIALEMLGIWLSPATWILAALILFSRYRALGLLLLAVLVPAQLLGYLASRYSSKIPALNPLYDLPSLPGRLGELVRKDLRQLLSYLDPYVALVLCGGTVIYRFASDNPDPEAATVISVLAAAIMGTSAQCLFGLDGRGGFTRYRLMPLRGWQILAAKGTAWLIVLAALVILLDPVAGLSAGMVALGIGHHRAVQRPLPQTRWRFAGGELLMLGLIQVGLAVSAGVYIHRNSAWWSLGCILFYLLSLWYYGRRWEALREE